MENRYSSKAIVLIMLVLQNFTWINNFAVANLLNFRLNVTNPLHGSIIDSMSFGYIDFDILFVDSLNNNSIITNEQVVIDLIQQSEANGNYKYYVCSILNFASSYPCLPILTVWPRQKATQSFETSSLLPGKRALTVRIVAIIDSKQDTIIAENQVDFTVKDMHAEIDIDLLSLTTNNGKRRAVESKDLFDEVYRIGFWQRGVQSVDGYIPRSGVGSTLASSKQARQMLLEVIGTYGIHGMADIPCGDMHWLPHVGSGFHDVKLDFYLGGDISSFLISSNNLRIEGLKEASDDDAAKANDQALYRMLKNVNEMKFEVINLIEGSPLSELADFKAGKVDLILCRDMMIHLSQQENLAVLENIQNSGAKYFIATTWLNFGDKVNEKPFQVVLGHFINLMQPPYCLVSPLRLYKEDDGESQSHTQLSHSKYLGLWKIERGKSMMQDSC